jgi:hypothetical protein
MRPETDTVEDPFWADPSVHRPSAGGLESIVRDDERPIVFASRVGQLAERRRVVHDDSVPPLILQTPSRTLHLRRGHDLRVAKPLAVTRRLTSQVVLARRVHEDGAHRL